jgi:Uma2 family endonuclease
MREPIVPELEKSEYLAWESRQRDRFELHHGFIVAFAGGTLDHDTISLNLQIALRSGFPPPCRVFGPNVKIEISATTFYYADAGVTCEDTDGAAVVVQRPVTVCEVLSESTRAYDVVEKRAAYRGLPSLSRYIIVHTRVRRVEIDSRAADGSWHTAVVEAGYVGLGGAQVAFDDVYAHTQIA